MLRILPTTTPASQYILSGSYYDCDRVVYCMEHQMVHATAVRRLATHLRAFKGLLAASHDDGDAGQGADLGHELGSSMCDIIRHMGSDVSGHEAVRVL